VLYSFSKLIIDLLIMGIRSQGNEEMEKPMLKKKGHQSGRLLDDENFEFSSGV